MNRPRVLALIDKSRLMHKIVFGGTRYWDGLRQAANTGSESELTAVFEGLKTSLTGVPNLHTDLRTQLLNNIDETLAAIAEVV